MTQLLRDKRGTRQTVQARLKCNAHGAWSARDAIAYHTGKHSCAYACVVRENQASLIPLLTT